VSNPSPFGIPDDVYMYRDTPPRVAEIAQAMPGQIDPFAWTRLFEACYAFYHDVDSIYRKMTRSSVPKAAQDAWADLNPAINQVAMWRNFKRIMRKHGIASWQPRPSGGYRMRFTLSVAGWHAINETNRDIRRHFDTDNWEGVEPDNPDEDSWSDDWDAFY
jgi:hypothetical protein